VKKSKNAGDSQKYAGMFSEIAKKRFEPESVILAPPTLAVHRRVSPPRIKKACRAARALVATTFQQVLRQLLAPSLCYYLLHLLVEHLPNKRFTIRIPLRLRTDGQYMTLRATRWQLSYVILLAHATNTYFCPRRSSPRIAAPLGAAGITDRRSRARIIFWTFSKSIPDSLRQAPSPAYENPAATLWATRVWSCGGCGDDD
jgi:hypothetical protein